MTLNLDVMVLKGSPERERMGGRMLPEKSRELGAPVFNVL